MTNISLKAIKIAQPIGDFYIASIPWDSLIKITFVDRRNIANEKDDIYKFSGIQRGLGPDRIRKLKQYVNTYDATFPTSVILSINESCVDWDEATNVLTLKPFEGDQDGNNAIELERIAEVLDGQHRIEGLKGYEGVTPFDINVSIFIEPDLATKANIFGTVNISQTKVNTSLVYDLFDYEKFPSPQKTCHNIAVLLDKIEESPFHGKIKRLGVATQGRHNETITQATFVTCLLTYITKNEVKDRDILQRGLKLNTPSDIELKNCIFRELFIEGKEEYIAKILINYFTAVMERWHDAWHSNTPGYILHRTNGFRALMRFLGRAYIEKAETIGDIVSKDDFLSIFAKSSLNNDQFTTDNYNPGAAGEIKLYKDLKESTGLN